MNEQGLTVDSTVTDAEGEYVLSGDGFQNYRVRVLVLPGFGVSPRDVGDDAIDSDIDPVTFQSVLFALADPADHLNWDVGLFPIEVGDTVWLDELGSGIQPPNPTGVPGVRIELLDEFDNVMDEALTDASGHYRIDAITTGRTYRLRATPPPGFVLSPADQGGDDLRDSDFDPLTRLTTTFSPTAGLDSVRWDLGLVPARVGDMAWLDDNGSGIQPSNPTGVPDIRIELLDEFGNVLHQTLTDESGRYFFEGVSAGQTYRLRADPPSGFLFSPPDRGTDDARDSDFDPQTRQTPPFAAGEAFDPVRWDLGLVPARIGDRVWLDRDRDGAQDPGEPGVGGIAVDLLDAVGGSVTATTVTDSTGRYVFPGTRLGSYRLRVSVPPEYDLTRSNFGGDTLDSDFDVLTFETAAFTLDSPDDFRIWDAGFVIHLNEIGDRVWEDADRDGVQDPGEPGFPGVTVELHRSAGGGISRTVTDEDGRYSFLLDPTQTHHIRFIEPLLARLTTADAGADDTADSDANPVSGDTIEFSSRPRVDEPQWDAGLFRGRQEIGDRIWSDVNGNGIQDAGEPGVPGIMLELFDERGRQVGTAITRDNGSYSFAGRFVGERYTLHVIRPVTGALSMAHVGTDDELDSDVDQITSNVEIPPLVAAAERTRWDIGIVFPNAMFGDRLWKDSNGNGLQDPREPGLPGHRVTVLTVSGDFIADRITDAQGMYRVGGLIREIAYTVQFAPVPGMRFTTRDAGDDDNRDSDVDTDGHVPTVHPSAAIDAERYDAGVVHSCRFPTLPMDLVSIAPGPDGSVILDWLDPNGSNVVSGYVVRRTGNVRQPILQWDVLTRNEPQATWTDSDVVPRGQIRYYLLAAYNDVCDAEGPW